ncbi:MAG: SDR family oxidoreductase [Planctomycetota bacterium]
MEQPAPAAIITGGGSGIGLETARLLVADGYRVMLVGRRADVLETATAELGDAALSLSADLSDPAAPERIAAESRKRFGRLDALVNNAGWSPLTPLVELMPETIEAIYRVNVIGPTLLARACWANLASATRITGRPGPCIVGVSSYATVDPFAGLGVYACAKAGINLLAKACRNEGAEFELRAFSVAPGAVETELLRSIADESTVPQDKTLAPIDVAQVIAACIRGDHDERNGETILLPSPD